MKGTEDAAVVLSEESIKDKIHTIRGQRVMLDVDLAKIYGYTTKTFKETTNKSIRGHAEGFFRQARKMPRRRSIATSNGI